MFFRQHVASKDLNTHQVMSAFKKKMLEDKMDLSEDKRDKNVERVHAILKKYTERTSDNSCNVASFVVAHVVYSSKKTDDDILDLLIPPEYKKEDHAYYQSGVGSCSL